MIAALTVAGLSVATAAAAAASDPATSVRRRRRNPRSLAADQDGNRGRKPSAASSGDFADADVRARPEGHPRRGRRAGARRSPGPVIDKAQQDGKITEAQADKLRQAAQDLADGKRPDIRGDLGRDEDVREVIHDAFEAAHEKAPGIAEPIIDKAVADNKITEAQADRIREMVRRGPPRGPHGHGLAGRFATPELADEDVRAVLEDVHEAVAKQAPTSSGP